MMIVGTPYDAKVSRTVWTGGKDGDRIKILPISISFAVMPFALFGHAACLIGWLAWYL